METAGAKCHFVNIKYSPGLDGPTQKPSTSLDTGTHPILKLYNKDSSLCLLPSHFKTSLGFTTGPKGRPDPYSAIPTAVSGVGVMMVPITGASDALAPIGGKG